MTEAKWLHPIYGDTDSIFLDDPQPAQVEWLIKAVKERLKLDLAIEKQYSLCVLPAAKKAYFGILLDGKPDLKGLTAIKSNSPGIIQTVFQECVKELGNVKTLGEYELAKKRIINVFRRAVRDVRNRRIPLEDLVYSVKLFFDPNERLAADVKVTPQPYQSAIQLLDAGKKVKGIKRHAAVDTLGLMIGLDITAADVQDRDGCIPMLKQVQRQFPFLEAVIADGGYQGVETAAAVYRAAGAPLQIVKRSDAAKGFQVLPKRWIVERTFRLARTLQTAGQRLRKPDPLQNRVRQAGNDPSTDT